MRSDAVKKGIAQAPQRSLMRALGLTEEENEKTARRNCKLLQ